MLERALLYCAGGGIGDSLVASVVARALRQKYDAVDALTLPGHKATLERVPDVGDVLVDDGGDENALVAEVKQRSYAACVVTWATPRTARVPQRAFIPVRVGQARRLYSFRFTDRVVVRSEDGNVTSHWSDILLDYPRAIGCDTPDLAYRFEPTAADDAEADGLCAALSVSKGDFVLLNPCNAIASKRGVWPVDGWGRVAAALHERFELPVLVSGSPADAPIAGRIVERASFDGLRTTSGIVSIAGKLGIGAFGALAKQARAFVGITTGSMHVAAAVGCPTVGIFPFQSDYPDRWAPLGARVAVVRPSYPCHAGDTKERCADYACIENLDVARIIAGVESLGGR